MKTNPLFYTRSNSNATKIRLAKRKLFLSLACIFAIAFITSLSISNSTSGKSFVGSVGVSTLSLGFLPFAAKVKGTLAINGEDETEEAFKARGEKPEDEVAFLKRFIAHSLAQEMKKSTPDWKTQLDFFKDQLAKAATGDALKQLQDEMRAQGLIIERMQDTGGKGKSIEDQIAHFIKENHAKILDIKRAGQGVVELKLDVKVAAAMTTGSATNPDGIPALMGVQSAPPSNVNLRTTIVDGLVSLFPTGLAAYPYTESVPKDGNYDFIAEAEAKPQIDFKIETRYAQPKKVAAYMLLTEESVTDIPGLQGIATDYLRAKHALKRQNGILFGDGTGDNLKGATEYGRAFVAGAMAHSVITPNFMDVVNAAITDIFTTHNYTDEMPYMANLVMINPIDFFTELVAAKDGFGRPLYPMASLFNRVTIGGATIVPFEDIPAGKIFVADMSKYNITNYIGYTVRIGWINDNFITNQFVILGESRLHGFVKKLDEQAFIYDDIDTIRTAITGV